MLQTFKTNLESSSWAWHFIVQYGLSPSQPQQKHPGLLTQFLSLWWPRSAGSLGRDTFWPAVLVGTQIRLGVSWLWWQLVEAAWHEYREASICVTYLRPTILGLQGAILQGSHLLKVQFITWHLKQLVLEEYQWGLNFFVATRHGLWSRTWSPH